MCHVDRTADKTTDLLNKELEQRHGLSSFDETLIIAHSFDFAFLTFPVIVIVNMIADVIAVFVIVTFAVLHLDRVTVEICICSRFGKYVVINSHITPTFHGSLRSG